MIIEITGFWTGVLAVAIVLAIILATVIWFLLPFVVSQRLEALIDTQKETNELLRRIARLDPAPGE